MYELTHYLLAFKFDRQTSDDAAADRLIKGFRVKV